MVKPKQVALFHHNNADEVVASCDENSVPTLNQTECHSILCGFMLNEL